jgi:hypothetical protein
MSSVREFRFRSPERDRATDANRIALIQKVVSSAVADATAEATGLRARIAQAQRSLIFPVERVPRSEADESRRADLARLERQLLAAETRLVEVRDHLAFLPRLACRVELRQRPRSVRASSGAPKVGADSTRSGPAMPRKPGWRRGECEAERYGLRQETADEFGRIQSRVARGRLRRRPRPDR